MKIWDCKIGEVNDDNLPGGADEPMRIAIAEAYKKLTGRPPDFIFSGWGGQLDKYERAVVSKKNEMG